jgi:hypothetical protein
MPRVGSGGSEERVCSLAKDLDRQFHETLGISVFAITVIRLAWRAFDTPPANPPMPPWISIGSKVVLALIYLLLLDNSARHRPTAQHREFMLVQTCRRHAFSNSTTPNTTADKPKHSANSPGESGCV